MDRRDAAPAVRIAPTVLRALLSAGAGAVAGGLLGAIYPGTAGGLLAALGGLGAFAWYLLHVLNGALAESERRILQQLGRPAAADARSGAEVPASEAAPEPPSSAQPSAAASASAAVGQLGEATPPPDTSRSASAGSAAHSGDVLRRGLRYARAWFRRGNPIARVGLVILFIGGAFLVKYAADNALLPLELRLAAVAAGAIVLLGFGWYLRERQRLYALTLQGGGVAALYLTVYATLRLYALIPPSVALAMMTAVSLAAAVLAVAQRAPALAVIGFAGGFAAPLLASSGSGDHVALFSYYAVLNLGVFTVAWFRAWKLLNLVGFVFTFGVSALWRGSGYGPEQLLSTDAFLLFFFAMYLAVSILFALRQPPNLKGAVSGTLVFGLPVVVFGLHGSLVADIEYALAWSAFGFGLCYMLLAWALFLAGRASLRLLAEAFAALGVIFASLAIPLAFDEKTTAAIWAVEGAGLLWLGIRQDRRLARAFGALLQLAAAGHYATGLLGAGGAQTPLFNAGFLGGAGLAVAGFLSGWWLFRAGERLRPYERHAAWGLLLWAVFWWLVSGINEVERFVAWRWQMAAGLSFLAGSVLLLDGLGRGARWQAAFGTAPLLAALVLVLGSLGTLEAAHPFARGAWLGWPLLWLSFYALLYRRDGDNARLFAMADRWLHALGFWTLAAVAATEAQWRIAQHVGGVWPKLAWGLVPAGLLWLGARAPGWPLAAQRAAYRFYASLPLVLVVALWLVATSLDSAGDPIVLPYVPLLNPLDIAAMLVLLALGGWWQALPGAERALLRAGHRALLPGLAAALVFLWMNAALIRAMHHLSGTPLLFNGVMTSTPVQAALSIFWGLLGFIAMIVATRCSLRVLWLGGAGLMAVVVAKLFLVDLAATGTLARIVSFLGVGALLLITGYFSPLPPKGEEVAEESA